MKMENTRFRVGDAVMLNSWINPGWYERNRNIIVRVTRLWDDGSVDCEYPIGRIVEKHLMYLTHAKPALIKRFIKNYKE